MKLRRIRSLLFLVFIAIFAISLVGCGTQKTSEPSNLSTVSSPQSTKEDAPIKLGFAKCAHCLPMALVPDYTKNVKVEPTAFPSGNDVLTALASKSIDIAQVTYLHYVTALDRGLDVVAISGEVNGGSEILVNKDIALKSDDWDGFKKIIEDFKKQGKPFRVATSRGNAQDIHMRGEFLLHGIDPDKDVQIINIPNPADHASALQRGEVDMICTVEPFASQIRLSGVGKHFAFPYNQAAKNLTNLIVTRSDVIKDHPQEVQEVVSGIVTMVDKLKTDKQMWLEVINKYTAMDKKVGEEALKNATPDYFIHRKETLAVVKMMKDLKYIQNDVSKQAEEHMDYSFLSKATGKQKEELGY